MVGRGKRTQAASSSNASSKSTQPPNKRQALSADWCADCWADVEDACLAGHRLLPKDKAVREAKAALRVLRDQVAEAQGEFSLRRTKVAVAQAELAVQLKQEEAAARAALQAQHGVAATQAALRALRAEEAALQTERRARRKEAQAALDARHQQAVAAAQASLEARRRDMAVAQARLDAVLAALDVKGPVLELEVGGCAAEGVQSGSVRVALAVANTTAWDKKALAAALEGLRLEVGPQKASADGFPRYHLGALIGKLACCAAGQRLRPGAVLLGDDGSLQIALDRVVTSGALEGARLLGYVQAGLDALRAARCRGQCGDRDRSCCCFTEAPASARLSGARFVRRGQ